MVAVGDDLARTCTCALVTWDGTTRPAPREIMAFDPATREEDGTEAMIVTIHNFDGAPCYVMTHRNVGARP